MVIEAVTNWANLVSSDHEIKVTEEIELTEENMNLIINEYRHDPEVAFAHCISADFKDNKHMSQGVAAVFKQQFGKPCQSNYSAKNLTYQQTEKGALVYGLVTKPKYFLNSENYTNYIDDYDRAFEQLSRDFKSRNLKKLICSPMGCIRDRVPLNRFVANLKKFSKETGASILIVSYNELSTHKLRNGLSHTALVRRLQELITMPSQSQQLATITVTPIQPRTQREPAPADQLDTTTCPEPSMMTPLDSCSPACQQPLHSAVVISDEGGISLNGVVCESEICSVDEEEACPESSVTNLSVESSAINGCFLDLNQAMPPIK